jgi:hypothetical protein
MLSAAKHPAAIAVHARSASAHRPAAITWFLGRSPVAVDTHRAETNKIFRFAQDDSGGNADARGAARSARLTASDQRSATTSP